MMLPETPDPSILSHLHHPPYPLGGAPGAVVKAACLESRRLRV